METLDTFSQLSCADLTLELVLRGNTCPTGRGYLGSYVASYI